jgi:hypothetical protein
MKRIRSFNERAAALLAVSPFLVAACTTYTPVRVAEAAPGYDVRVSLTDQGAVDLVPKIGPRARVLEGTLKTANDTALVLSVRRVTREGGGDDSYDSLLVSLPPQDVAVVERSQTSVTRSILAAGAIVATALLAAKGAGDIGGGKTPGTPGTGK